MLNARDRIKYELNCGILHHRKGRLVKGLVISCHDRNGDIQKRINGVRKGKLVGARRFASSAAICGEAV